MKETICYAVLHLAEGLIAWFYFNQLFELKTKKEFAIATHILGYLILFTIFQLNIIALNGVVFLIVNAVLLFSNYYCKVLPGILHSAYMCFIMSITEFVVAIGLRAIFHDYAAYTYSFVALIALGSLSKLLYFMVMILSVKIFKPQKGTRLDLNTILLFCLLPVTSIVIIIAFVYLGMTVHLSSVPSVLMLTSTLLLLMVNILSVLLYNNLQKVNQENLSMQLMLQKEQADTDYYAMLQTQYDQQRILIHDIKNHAQIIRSLIREHQGDELENYLEHFESLPELRQKMRLCDNHVCNLLLLQFLGQCREAGVSLHHDIRGQSISFLDPTDITALFGNLLSNALEAAKQSEKKAIEISARCQKDQGVTLVVVKNSCDQPPARGSDGQYLTRKPDKANHGIGLKSIRRIAKKYKGDLELYYDPEQKLFHTIILLRHP